MNAEQASKPVMWEPTHPNHGEGRLICPCGQRLQAVAGSSECLTGTAINTSVTSSEATVWPAAQPVHVAPEWVSRARGFRLRQPGFRLHSVANGFKNCVQAQISHSAPPPRPGSGL